MSLTTEGLDYLSDNLKNNIFDTNELKITLLSQIEIIKSIINKINNLNTRDLTDVHSDSPPVSGQQVLIWSTTNNKWEPKDLTKDIKVSGDAAIIIGDNYVNFV